MNNDKTIIGAITRAFGRLSSWVSALIDKLLYSKRFLALVSLAISLLIFSSVIYSSQLANQINQSTELVAQVEIIGDLDEYEISEVRDTVNVTVTGSAIDVRAAQNTNNYSAVLDISNLSEGTHRVQLERKGFSQSLKVIFQPDTVEVNISRKTSEVFEVTPNFINLNKVEPQFNLSNPTLEVNEVTINTSQEKLGQISEVRALIDVANKTETFSSIARVVAYDQEGRAMDVDIEPNEINASVSISSPNKQVDVVVNPVGVIPNDMAIESITLDHPSITLYGPEEVLDSVSNILATIDATQLTNVSTELRHTLVRPEGVRSMDIETVNIGIILAPRVSEQVEQSQIFFENNTNNYDIARPDGTDLVVDVTLSGTQNRIDNLNVSTIRVSLDMNGLRPGRQMVTLNVSGSDQFVNYELMNNEIEVVISEKGEE
ncbi:MAG TPA: hypothetical protein GX703_03680 [Erysipelothrix sp.]|nr:hypothetical protein [Erysipelothrix sp.]